MFWVFYFIFLFGVCNSLTIRQLSTYQYKEKIITIAPCGIYGFYELGTLTYIKLHYDLTNILFLEHLPVRGMHYFYLIVETRGILQCQW